MGPTSAGDSHPEKSAAARPILFLVSFDDEGLRSWHVDEKILNAWDAVLHRSWVLLSAGYPIPCYNLLKKKKGCHVFFLANEDATRGKMVYKISFSPILNFLMQKERKEFLVKK